MPTTTPVTPVFYETAPIRLAAARELSAPPDEVFATLADTPSWPDWFPAITRARWTSPAPYGVGSTRTVAIGPFEVDEEFIIWEPGVAWGFTFRRTSLPVARAGAELVELEPTATGTRVTYHMCLDPLPGLGGVTRMLRRGVEKGLADGLAGLERHLD